MFFTLWSGKPVAIAMGTKIVATNVAEHGGNLSLESVPGKTVFRVRLPAADAPPQA